MNKGKNSLLRRKGITRRQLREWKYGYLFLLPWLIGIFVFFFFAIFNSLQFSFSKFTLDAATGIKLEPLAHFWDNYSFVFKNKANYLFSLQTYVGTMVLQVPMIVAFSLIIAIMLNDQFKGRTLYRALFFLPVIVATGPVMTNIETNQVSIFSITAFANLLGELPEEIFGVFSEVFASLFIVLWHSGIQILLYLAGLQKVSTTQYEAAKIDGASVWESFWKITIPNIRPFILLNAIYSIVFLSGNDNEPINFITTAVSEASSGYAVSMAMAWMYALVVLLMLLAAYLILRPHGEKKNIKYEQTRETLLTQRRQREERGEVQP